MSIVTHTMYMSMLLPASTGATFNSDVLHLILFINWEVISVIAYGSQPHKESVYFIIRNQLCVYEIYYRPIM